MEHKWESKAMAFKITLLPQQDCWIDEIHVNVLEQNGAIYSRLLKINPVHLAKGDAFTTLLQFNVSMELD